MCLSQSSMAIDLPMSAQRMSSTSSKGNQAKYYLNSKWVKVDFLGYEGLSEVVVSDILRQSNVQKYSDYVPYYLCHGRIETPTGWEFYRGCYSEDFTREGYEFITLQRLFSLVTDAKFAKRMERMTISQRISTVVALVEEHTGLADFGQWLTVVLELDALVLNEDRHFHNLGLLRHANGQASLMPIFDAGAAFLSDSTKDYALHFPTPRLLSRVKSKPFASTFKKQVTECQQLYSDGASLLAIDIDYEQTISVIKDLEHYQMPEKERVIYLLQRLRK